VRSWKRRVSELEAELGARRPEPRPEFLDALVARVGEPRERSRPVRLRLGMVAGITALLLVGAGVFGGIAYSTGGGGGFGHGAPGGGGSSGGDGGDGDHHGKPSDHQYKHKVVICHHPGSRHPITIRVDQHALKGHLRHGDYTGACHR